MTIRNLIECDAPDCEDEIITNDGETTRHIIDRSHELGWITVKKGDRLANICKTHAEAFGF